MADIARPAANPEKIAIRAYLRNAGLDNDKITYNDGKVYYGDRSITPTANINGVTYANESDLKNFVGGVMNDNGLVGVRDTFSQIGLDTSKLGYNNGKVSYGGQTFTPTANVGGVTYAKKDDIIDFAGRAGKSEQNPLIRINAYKNEYGIDDLGWDASGGKVLIGGEEIPYAYIDKDGNAWAFKNVLDKRYKDIADKLGIRSYSELLKRQEEADAKFNNRLDELKNRKFEFTTQNLYDNPVWRAYAAMYDEAAEKAYKDTLSKASARTGGNISTMALVAADEARNRMLKEKESIIPTIAEMAYRQYGDAFNNDLSVLGQQYNSEIDRIARDRELSERALEGINSQNTSQYNRKVQNLDLKNMIDTQNYQWASILDAPIPASIAIEYNIAPKADGTYPTPNELEIGKNWQNWENYEKPIYDYKFMTDLQSWYAKHN